MINQVHVGETFKPNARRMNAMIAAANAHALGVRAGGQNQVQNLMRQATVIKVRNDSGAARSQYDILGMDSPVVTPSENLNEFKREQVMSCSLLDDEVHAAPSKAAVLLEPARIGGIVRACVAGVCAVQVAPTTATTDFTSARIIDGQHQYLALASRGQFDIIWREAGDTGQKWAIVRHSSLAPSAMVPVKCTQSGGSPGNLTTRCSYTYEVRDAEDNVLEDSVSNPMTPAKPRTSVGLMLTNPDNSWGTGWFASDGTFYLWDAGEVPSVDDCDA